MLTVSDNEVNAALAKDKFRPYLNFLSLFENSLKVTEIKDDIFKSTFLMFTKTTLPL